MDSVSGAVTPHLLVTFALSLSLCAKCVKPSPSLFPRVKKEPLFVFVSRYKVRRQVISTKASHHRFPNWHPHVPNQV
jgi:hypothetical protein